LPETTRTLLYCNCRSKREYSTAAHGMDNEYLTNGG